MNYQDVYDQTKKIIVDYLRVDPDEVKPETNLVIELAVDSIALVELGFRFAENFTIPMPQPTEELYIMKNLVQYLTDEINKQRTA